MTVRQKVTLPAEDPAEHAAFLSNPDHHAEHDAIAHPETEYCHQNCGGNPEDHPVTWRIHPRPDPGPIVADGVITDLVSCCTCCAWSCGTEGFVERLQRESYDGRDIRIERLVDGRWTNFEARF
jgi:hypothetical protein